LKYNNFDFSDATIFPKEFFLAKISDIKKKIDLKFFNMNGNTSGFVCLVCLLDGFCYGSCTVKQAH